MPHLDDIIHRYDNDNEECVICLDDIKEDTYKLNCQCKTSFYHYECICQWINDNHNCPTCKTNFSIINDSNDELIIGNASRLTFNLHPIDYRPSGVVNASSRRIDEARSVINNMVQYVYLDSDGRRRFAQVGHEYLIEQIGVNNTFQ